MNDSNKSSEQTSNDHSNENSKELAESVQDDKQSQANSESAKDNPLNPGPSRVGQSFDSVRMEIVVDNDR